MKPFFKLLQTHWLAIVLISIGTWLRFTHLPDKGILFNDSGRDLLVAAEAVNHSQLPLLGIPSSVPRFAQGPLTIWLSMLIYHLVGYQPAFYYYVFAGIGSLALIALYEFCLVWLNRRIGLIALALLSFSPLAIAHSRMIYHTVPIAFLTVISLWALARVWEHRAHSWWWAGLATALLFQHELSLFPIFMAIPLAWWGGAVVTATKSWKQIFNIPGKTLFSGLLGIGLGLWPQMLSEFRDSTHQLSGFALWLGYRLVSFFLPGSSHFGLQTLHQALTSMTNYLGWVITLPTSSIWQWISGILLLSIVGWGGYRWWRTGRKIEAAPAVITLVTVLISVGYIFHGAPSEAYFPVYCVLLPLVVAVSWHQLPTIGKWGGGLLIASLSVSNLVGLPARQFLVDQPSGWSYGPSFGTQRQVLEWAAQQTPQTTFTLLNQGPTVSVTNSLASYVWIGRTLNLTLLPITSPSITRDANPRLIIDHPPTETQPLIFTDFHGATPKVKVFHTSTQVVHFIPSTN